MSGVIRKIIQTALAPKPVGPYNQAVRVGNTVYLSGQVGIDPAVGKMVDGGVEKQTEQTLKNLGEVLKAAGATYDNVVKVTVLLADMGDFTKVNGVYGKYFVSNHPTRMCYAVKTLPLNAAVEIDAIAVLDLTSE